MNPSSDPHAGDVIHAMRRMESLRIGTGRQRAGLIEECRRTVGASSMALCRVPRKGELVLVHLAGPPPDANAVQEIIACASKRTSQSFSLLRRRASGDLALAGRGSDVVSAIFSSNAEPWAEHVVAFVAERLVRSSTTAQETSEPAARTAAGLVLPSEMIAGTSPVMRDLLAQMQATVSSRLDVLLSGETGTGKELLARIVHDSGPTRGGPFVAINCAAIASELLESELFGVERHVATGVDPRAGLFLEADRGSMFLDEIAELPERLQPKLLRVIQEREVLAVGARPRKISVRIIAASNQDLAQLVSAGRFRADLYYRLRGLEFHSPPLRERTEDIPALALEFLRRTAEEYGKQIPGISNDAVELLTNYPWPGNIRELQTEIRRAALICADQESLKKEHLGFRLGASASPAPIALVEDVSPTASLLRERVAMIERAEIESAMREAGGNRSLAARLLGITRNGLAHKIQRLGLAQELRRSAK